MSTYTMEKQITILTKAKEKLWLIIVRLPPTEPQKQLLSLILTVVEIKLDILTLQWLWNDNTVSVAIVPVISTPDHSTQTTITMWTSQQVLLEKINQIRRENWLHELEIHSTLQELAQNHVDEMVQGNYFSHTNLAGYNSIQRVEKSWYTFSFVWETLATNAVSADITANGWLWSTQWHREIMLSTQATEIGIGYNSNWHKWTAVYAAPL
jgi:uncharacterized protein YkwD